METKRRKRHRDNSTYEIIAIITGNRNHYSLISININGLNSPIKGHRLSHWIHKQNPAFFCIQETISETKTDTISE